MVLHAWEYHCVCYRSYSVDDAGKDFPGLRYTRGTERADVGEGTLRVTHPKGPLPHTVCASIAQDSLMPCTK
jgi:hypothetical protein